ncbi:MAG: (2Fe-2S)-binding protein [Treponema sp.]|jgi:NAD(P)H-nitrite reductase large subunit|nr:(2Fe-2S)-binding protein [Treponema sp.]
MDKDIIICRCQEISLREILKAIADGARTIDGVKKRTRAGMGFCQGKSCQRLIAQILSRETGRNMAELLPPTFRAPVRPVRIGVLIRGDGDE